MQQKMTETVIEMKYGSSLVTFYNKNWCFLYTVRQSLINGRNRGVISAG